MIDKEQLKNAETVIENSAKWPTKKQPLLTLDVYADGDPCRLRDAFVETYVIVEGELEYVDREWSDKAQYRKNLGNITVQPVRLEVHV